MINLLIKYIVLGIIQGFTEPLPISSSGHLMIFKELFKSKILNDMNFEIIVNFGSLLAILYLYKNEIIDIIKDFFLYLKTKNKKYEINYKYSWLIVIGTIPAVIFGLFIKDFIENNFNTKLVGLMFIITSLLLYMIKDIKGKKEKKDIKCIDALKIGLFQALALLPGISRSGATIVGAMKCDLKRETALNFSFMLYIPMSIAAMTLEIGDLSIKKELILNYTLAVIVAAIVTFLVTKWFRKIVNEGKLIYFSIYCFIVGTLVVIFL